MFQLGTVTSTLFVSGVIVRCQTLTRESSAADRSYNTQWLPLHSRLRSFLDLKIMSETIQPRNSPGQKKEQCPASISSERGRWPPRAEFPSLPRKSESDLFRNLPPRRLSTVWPMSSSCWRRRRRRCVVAVEGWRRDIVNIRLGQREETEEQMTDREESKLVRHARKQRQARRKGVYRTKFG